MAKVCEIMAGKAVLSGNRVSHSNRKTRRRFLPNLNTVSLISDVLARTYKMRIAANTLRSIDINGGFDNYLLTTSSEELTETSRRIKKAIQKKLKLAENTTKE